MVMLARVCACARMCVCVFSIIEKEQPINGQVYHSHLLSSSLDLINLPVHKSIGPEPSIEEPGASSMNQVERGARDRHYRVQALGSPGLDEEKRGQVESLECS